MVLDSCVRMLRVRGILDPCPGRASLRSQSMVPSGDISPHLDPVGFCLQPALPPRASPGRGSEGRGPGGVLALLLRPPATHASPGSSVRRKCRLLLPATAGRAGRLPSSSSDSRPPAAPPPLGASAAPSVQWGEEPLSHRPCHRHSAMGIFLKAMVGWGLGGRSRGATEHPRKAGLASGAESGGRRLER